MKNSFNGKRNAYWMYIATIGVLLSGVWLRYFGIGDGSYSDEFHHGEFVATLPELLSAQNNFISIHGALDWAPAWIAYILVGADHYFSIAMLTYTSFSALGGVFLFWIVASLTRESTRYRAMILTASAVLGISFVGIRDIWMLLALGVFINLEDLKSARLRLPLEALLGAILAFNLFWSFDRGLAALGAIGLGCAIGALSQRRYLVTLATFVLVIFILNHIPAFSLVTYWHNLRFLLATSSQWHYGYSQFMPIYWTVVVLIPNLWVAYYLLRTLHQVQWSQWQKTGRLFVLLALLVLMFKAATNRADEGHVVMALWMPAISLIYLWQYHAVTASKTAYLTILIPIFWMALRLNDPVFAIISLIPAIMYSMQNPSPRLTTFLSSTRFSVLVFALPLVVINGLKMNETFGNNAYIWIQQLRTPPENKNLVLEDVRWVAAESAKTQAKCVFDLSNNGVINGLANIPACTSYTYPVYATLPYEDDMLRQLKLSSPPMVVYSSEHWAFNIDGRSMHERFPKIKAYLLQTYPYEKCHGRYCLRYLKQPD